MPAIDRSRLGPNLSCRVRVVPTRASETSKSAMYPSFFNIWAMCTLSFEFGIDTASWCAEFAFRKRVSMSATGSVIVMAGMSLLSPRFTPRYANGDLWWGGSAGGAGLGGCRVPGGMSRMRHPLCVVLASDLPEREAQLLEQCATLIVGPGGGHHGDVHTPDSVDSVLVNLVEHRLLGETESVVAVAVELAVTQATKVPDARQREREQPVEELPHPVTAERDVASNRLALTEFELRDRLPCLGHKRLLAGDEGEIGDSTVDDFAIASGLTHTHVHNDLHETGHLVHVLVAVLLRERGDDLAPVFCLQTWLARRSGSNRGCGIGHGRSLPDFFA